MEVEAFGQLLSSFLSPDENVRKAAEQQVNLAKKQSPDELLQMTLQVLASDLDATKRQQAAVLVRNILRGFIYNTDDALWNSLKPESKASFKVQILQILDNEKSSVVKRAVGDVVADVGGALLDADQWPDLPAYIVGLCQSADASNSAIGMRTLAELIPKLSAELPKDIDGFAQLIRAKLESGDMATKVQCMSVLAQLVCHEERSLWKRFQPMVPLVLDLIRAAAPVDEDSLESVLRSICEIGEVDPELFKPHIQAVLETLIVVARNAQLEVDSRQLAVEAVLCIVDSKPQMCIKVPNFLDVMVETLMEFMLSIDEEWDSLDITGIDESVEEGRKYNTGESGIDRLVETVGGDLAMPIVFKNVAAYLQHPDWQHKFSAIMAISQTVEYLDEDDIEAQLAQIVTLLLQHLADPHPRVRFAACQAVGQTSLDHQPYLQETYADRILPALITTFEDSVARVQAHAISAFINFGEEVSVKDLGPHAELLMQKFLARLSPDFQMPTGDEDSSPDRISKRSAAIREQSLTAVAVVAGVIEKDFAKYYSTVVPLTKLIVENCTSKEEKSLRGKALECLSIIGFSVGLDMFRADAEPAMRAMIMLLKSEANQMEEDDPVKSYLHEAVKRMIKVLGKEFAPFLPEILPYIKTYLTKEIEAKPFTQEQGVDEEEDIEQCKTRTAEMEETRNALELVESIVEATGELYCPAVADTFALTVPLLDAKKDSSIRHQALLSIAELFVAAKAGNMDKSLIVVWITQVVEVLFKQATVEDVYPVYSEIDDMTADMGGLARCLECAGPDVLTDIHVEAICAQVFTLMQKSSSRRDELGAAAKDPENDEEDAGRLEMEQEREQVYRSTLLETIGAIMKFHPALFMVKGANLCLEFMRKYLDPKCSVEDRALAIYLADDILEQLGEKGQPLWPEFAEKLCLMVTDKDAHVRQAACYGCVWIGKMQAGVWDVNYLRSVVAQLDSVLADPASLKKENRMATENGIAALFAFIVHSPHAFVDAASLAAHATAVTKLLPIKSDTEEGCRLHEEFVSVLSDPTKGALFLGEGNANLPQIVKMLGAIYCSTLTTEETDVNIRKLISQMGQQSVLEMSSKTSLSPTERKGLEKIFADAAASA